MKVRHVEAVVLTAKPGLIEVLQQAGINPNDWGIVTHKVEAKVPDFLFEKEIRESVLNDLFKDMTERMYVEVRETYLEHVGGVVL